MDNGQCTVFFRNGIPPRYGVRIIEIGVKFFYQNESGTIVREWQTQSACDLDSGEEAALSSDDDDGCVQQVFVAMKLYRPSEGELVLTGHRVVEPKKCLMQTRFVVAPKASVTSSAKTIEEALAAAETSFELSSD